MADSASFKFMKEWTVRYVRHRGSLLQGLRAMSELVELIDEETLALKLGPVGKAETNAKPVHSRAQ